MHREVNMIGCFQTNQQAFTVNGGNPYLFVAALAFGLTSLNN